MDVLKVLEKMRLGHCGALNLAKVMRDYAADGELEGVNSPEEFDEGIEESRVIADALAWAIAIIKAAEAIVPVVKAADAILNGEEPDIAPPKAQELIATFLSAMKEG